MQQRQSKPLVGAPNRKARRAAKARTRGAAVIIDDPLKSPPPDDAAIAERIRARRARERAEREAKWAGMSDTDILRLRIEESRGEVDFVTGAFLGLSVPMWIEEMRAWSPDRREHKAHELSEVIAYGAGAAALADPDRRGTTKRGALGGAFNAVAQGLACLAFCPGGVVFAGHHWEATGAR
jgi:hypothetical protein